MAFDLPDNNFEILQADKDNIYLVIFSIQLTLREDSAISITFPAVSAELVTAFVREGISQDIYDVFKVIFARCKEDYAVVLRFAGQVLEQLVEENRIKRVSIDGNANQVTTSYSIEPGVIYTYLEKQEKRKLSLN